MSHLSNQLHEDARRRFDDLGLRLLRVEPMDESLESVFSYVVEG